MWIATIALVVVAAADELEALRVRLDEERDAESRVAALENAPVLARAGPGVADAIGGLVVPLLRDDDMRVRAGAARALREIDVETTLREVPRAIRAHLRDERAAYEAILEYEPEKPPPDAPPGKILESAIEKARRMSELAEQVDAARQCSSAFAAALAGLRDDRAVEGIVRLLDGMALGRTEPYVDYLLDYRTRNAIEPVVHGFAPLRKLLRKRAAERRKLDRERPRKNTMGWMTDEAWEGQERRRIDGARAAHDAATASIEARREHLRERLATLGTELGLPEPPAADAHPSIWKSWWRRARENVPATVAAAEPAGD